MFNLDTCKFVVWGYKNPRTYHTHGHIHEAIYRTLKYMGKDVVWTDATERVRIDLENTLVVSNHDCCTNNYWPWEDVPLISKLPISKDNFYVIHGLNDDPQVTGMFENQTNYLSWNVYHDYSDRIWPTHDVNYWIPLDGAVWLDTDIPFYPSRRHLNFRWATDLVPSEIEALKPKFILGRFSRVVNWVGTVWRVNDVEITAFKEACERDHRSFNHIGAGQNGVVSIEKNIELIRSSYMAPAISGSHHLTEGYAPCRIFKNISYGQYGITNSKRVNEIFEGRLIYNPDPFKLYYEAKERLASLQLSDLHSLMDFVAKKHTYINRLEAVFKAVRLIQ